jgi:AcrR family transcriptional regulator
MGARDTRPARERVLAAAVELFAEHGVSGTSLQMIADRMGVTKAAVYHQFPTKEEIVLAVIGPALARLAEIADAAERQRTRPARLETVLTGLVDLVVEHRRLAAILQFDPMVERIVRAHPSVSSTERLRALLTGGDGGAEAAIGAAMVSGGLVFAPLDPALAGVGDEELRGHLMTMGRHVLRLRAITPAR